MKIDDFLIEPVKSLQYSERYINDGSPSGFTEKYRTSIQTDPYGPFPSFNLFSLDLLSPFRTSSYGILKENPFKLDSQFLVHPDMLDHEFLKDIETKGSIEVVPTSSARTVQILNEKYPFYVKLHYDGIIGRIKRRLPLRKSINGFELSKQIKEQIELKTLPTYFSILDEFYVSSIQDKSSESWSYILRDYKPFGNVGEATSYMLPLFAFWSKNRIDSGHSYFYRQFFSIWGNKKLDILHNKIIIPLIDIYFNLLTKMGLQNELNAQNILLAFDSEHVPVGIVFRDLMGIEKDLTLRNNLGLSNNFLSNDYKIIDESKDRNNWQIRHSFSFDFKFCQYILQPLVDTIDSERSRNKITDDIKVKVKNWLKLLPDNFFPPENRWYLHEKELLVDNRKYVTKQNPIFR